MRNIVSRNVRGIAATVATGAALLLGGCGGVAAEHGPNDELILTMEEPCECETPSAAASSCEQRIVRLSSSDWKSLEEPRAFALIETHTRVTRAGTPEFWRQVVFAELRLPCSSDDDCFDLVERVLRPPPPDVEPSEQASAGAR